MVRSNKHLKQSTETPLEETAAAATTIEPTPTVTKKSSSSQKIKNSAEVAAAADTATTIETASPAPPAPSSKSKKGNNNKKAEQQQVVAPADDVSPSAVVVESSAAAAGDETVIAEDSSSSSATANAAAANSNIVIQSAVQQELAELGGLLNSLTASLVTLKTKFKNIEKNTNKAFKNHIKQQLSYAKHAKGSAKNNGGAGGKKMKRAGNRKPSGFVKPTKISEELAAFLNKDPAIEMSRTDVSREINAYIVKNALQDKTNGRRILADASLAKLLNIDVEKEELTYFNLQRYMKHHFKKNIAAAIDGTSSPMDSSASLEFAASSAGYSALVANV